MSQTTPSSITLTRRTMLAGTAASAAVAAAGFGMPGGAALASQTAGFTPSSSAGGAKGVCANHHRELATHLKGILNSAYVDERMRNTVLRTTNCPHCRVGITPDMMDRTAFSIL